MWVKYKDMAQRSIHPETAASSAPAVMDLIAGRLDMMITVVPAIKSHIEAGTLRALCVLDDKRLAALPEVPTADEVGLSGLRSNIWYGLVAPKGTPQHVVERLQAAVSESLKIPAVAEQLAAQGTIPIGDSASNFAATIQADTAKYADLIKTAGITVSN